MPSTNTITKHRQRIDEIDRQLFTLFKERAQVVAAVGKIKAEEQASRCFIRPGREASMMKSSMGVDVAPFPSHYLAAMWRMLINGSLHIEQDLHIAVYAPGGSRDFFWLAREYFGPAVATFPEALASRVIGRVAEGQSHVGILPYPEDSDDLWWLSLAEDRERWPKVFAMAPYLKSGEKVPKALLIGDVVPEDFGQDATLIVLEAKETISRAAYQDAFGKAGVKARCLKDITPKQSAGAFITSLYEMEGFHDHKGGAVKKIRKSLGERLNRATVIGWYAQPLEIKK